MKIIFISSALEPGRDGAGDQIRRLAAEMILSGNESGIISLNDKYITEEVNGFQETQGVQVPVLRLPSILSPAIRFSTSAAWIRKFDAEWVSLHYVNFGFHRYGLPLEMITSLNKLSGNARLNIMFWELWCGMDANSGAKERLLGFIQKIYIRLMIRRSKPDSIFASTEYYIYHLNQIGVKSTLVPVIGNIKVGNMGADEEWEEVLLSSGLSEIVASPEKWLTVGFFGTFYVCPGLKELLEDSAKAATKLGKRLAIITIGKGRSSSTEQVISSIVNAGSYKTGMLSPEMINRIMEKVHLGIVTSSAHGLTKSSSAVAWKERGIPILISKQDKTYNKSLMEKDGVFQVNSEDDVLKLVKHNLVPQNPIEEVMRLYNSLPQKKELIYNL